MAVAVRSATVSIVRVPALPGVELTEAGISLLARVRSLVRLKMAADELRMRAVTSREIGISDPEMAALTETGAGGRVLLVDDRKASYERIAGILTAEHTVDVEPNPQEALFHAAEHNYECLIVSLGLENFDGLRLCSQVRSLDRTRGVPILMIAEVEDNARLLRIPAAMRAQLYLIHFHDRSPRQPGVR